METDKRESLNEVPNAEHQENATQMIKPINRDTVHRICSGQVVLSLAGAMKELVENSIDAEATIINIRLKEYGSELIEVSDNGSGVLTENFEALTLKHYTSKIRQFSDLETIGTLGFRGEALSSLCALSDLVITTKHHTASLATKIIYDSNGKIVKQEPTAREQGTTVTLEKLFCTLPVRRKEFMKNLKKDFSKMCQLLYAYCLVSKGIKFTCTNVTATGSKSTVVCTEGKDSVRANIINVFGARQISTLIDVEIIVPEDQILSEYEIGLVPGEELPFTFEFLISSVTHGSGRSTTDRQFFFINSRPCDPNKLVKLINAVYRQFNPHQYPFVYLNIFTKSLLVDVNVTPDKRQIFLENEKIMLATVKASLLEAFKAFPSTYKIQNSDVSKMVNKNLVAERGIKRSLTGNGIKKGKILETFKKRSKTEGDLPTKSFDLTQPLETEIINEDCEDSDAEENADKKLDMLIEMACKLSNDENKERLVDSENIDMLEISLDQPVEKARVKKSIVFDVSLDKIREALKESDSEETDKNITVKFRSEIKPDSNKTAEEELQKQISKTDFSRMDIIGQFNLGFIIAKLNNDLFIIDQHATDEKYNFEQLQLTTTIDSQVLVNPKPLELTAGNESLLIDNIKIFQKNGFSFKIDETAPCTKKVAMAAIPVSKNCVFGKDDIDEMLFMLQDSSHTMCRPSRVRSMFASRACRKSVMIGKHLSKLDMRKLVDHMGEIDQPWNCPHGRPTMRHLINLNLVETAE